ncbi:MAG: M20 family metallopeptidase [Helicobacteraceae bacterium]|nr:M20 family metallopeptidase [Helicobacteraceae bacterium]
MQYLKDLQTLCAINSYTQNKSGVDQVARQMQQWLEPLGFETKLFSREIIGDHYLFESKKVPGDTILLLGHNDTVFPLGAFDTFDEDAYWVYGPGVCDMKGGNIVALESLKELFKKNHKIQNIDFLLVSDEESGSDDSKALTLSLAKNYDYCFVFEAAGENLEVVTGRKGVGTYTISITGKAAHAGVRYTEGINANLEASYKLQELTKLTNLSLGTTVNVGKITGGIGANTISPKCDLLLEIRYTSEQEQDRLLAALEKITQTSYVDGTSAVLSGLIQRDVMEPNKAQEHFIQTLEKISGHKLPTEQRGGVSDANHVSSCGVVTLDGFGPFGDGDHTTSERALKSSFVQRIDLMHKIFDFHQSNNCQFN